MASGDKTYIADKPTQDAILEKVNSIDSTKATETTLEEVKSLINQMISTPSSPIKHIQRGNVKIYQKQTNVTLSGFTDINKMVVSTVIFDYEQRLSFGEDGGITLTENKLTFNHESTYGTGSYDTFAVYYQVVEYI